MAHANHLLVDGGAVNPLPLDQIDADSDITVGIDVNGDPSETLNRTNYKALDVWFGAAQIMMHSLIAHMMAAYPPDLYIRPHLAQVGALEFWRVKEIIAHAEKEKDRFKWLLNDKIEAWHADQQRTIATAAARCLGAQARNNLGRVIAGRLREVAHAVVDRAGLVDPPHRSRAAAAVRG